MFSGEHLMIHKVFLVSLVFVFSFISLGDVRKTPVAEFDLLIAHGRIIDGSGNPWFAGDIGIKDGRIAEIGRIESSRAAKIIEAKGLVVAPGFIDVHTHIESGIARGPVAENFLRM